MRFDLVKKIILFGGGELLRQFSTQLQKKGYAVRVFTSERHAAAPGLESAEKLSDFLSRNSIPYTITHTLDAADVIHAIAPDAMGISIGAPWIFKPDFIARFRGKLINLHGAPLPEHRGGGGFSWRILMGDDRGCSLIHLIDARIDTGDIVRREDYRYPATCRIPLDFEKYTIKKYLAFLRMFLADVQRGKDFRLKKQDESKSVYWPRLTTKTHGFIDWNWDASDIVRFIRAFDTPYKGASTFLGDRRLRLKQCRRHRGEREIHPFQYGLVYRIHGGEIFIAARGDGIAVSNILDENGSAYHDAIKIGDRLFTPNAYLEEAKKLRAIYTPRGLKKLPY